MPKSLSFIPSSLVTDLMPWANHLISLGLCILIFKVKGWISHYSIQIKFSGILGKTFFYYYYLLYEANQAKLLLQSLQPQKLALVQVP